jgi:hypothetical protein
MQEKDEKNRNGSLKDSVNNDDLDLKENNNDNPSVQALADHLMSIARHERMV